MVYNNSITGDTVLGSTEYLIESIDDFINNLTNGSFFRIHRSYAINIMHLETINGASVKVAQKEIPLQKPYRQELLRLFKSV